MLIIEQQQNVVVMNKKQNGGVCMNIIKRNLCRMFHEFMQKLHETQKTYNELQQYAKFNKCTILVKNGVPFPITYNELITLIDITTKNKIPINKLTTKQFNELIKFVEQKTKNEYYEKWGWFE